jgi:hypothetical protein
VQSDLKAFAEAVVVLAQAADTVGRDARQFELFLLRKGNGFRRPSDPVDPAWRQLPVSGRKRQSRIYVAVMLVRFGGTSSRRQSKTYSAWP